jgi:hypothetical protein
LNTLFVFTSKVAPLEKLIENSSKHHRLLELDLQITPNTIAQPNYICKYPQTPSPTQIRFANNPKRRRPKELVLNLASRTLKYTQEGINTASFQLFK